MDDFQIKLLFLNNWMIDVEEDIDGIKFFTTFVDGNPVLEIR